jgi:cell division protein FtsW
MNIFVNRGPLDRAIILSVIFLLGIGLVQVYSSSYIFAIESYGDGLHFFRKQFIFAAIGLLVLFAFAYWPTQWLLNTCVVLWTIAFAGVVLTLIPGMGVRVGGAIRWLNLGGGLRFEPSELLKYMTPAVCALIYARDMSSLGPIPKFFLYLIPVAPIILLLKQPDFGSVAIICVVIFTLIFTLGLKWRYVISGAATMTLAFYFLVLTEKYRMARILAFLDPWADPANKGFQVIQSMLGFYSGGLTGVGIGQGQGKLYFLPEAHTDFTLAVLGEEWGFIGMLIVLSVFGFIVLRGLQISVRLKNTQHQIIALGMSLTFALTVIINTGVATGLLPTKGLGMPFLSYGGSALIVTMAFLGVLINLQRNATQVPITKNK